MDDTSDAALFEQIKDAFHDDPGRDDAPSAGKETIAGYELAGEIHRGGQGVVYKARHRASGRTVALKLLLEGAFASERQRHRFEREIDVAAGLQHPNIVTLFDSGVDKGRPYYVMQYVEGVPVDTYVTAKHLAVEPTLELFADICEAVSYAHRHGVIHRDLKPENILVDSDGQVHVLDFGLAKLATDTADLPLTMTGEFVGTLAFASPEQASGDPAAIDTRTDVYSLGVILYRLLTGEQPYPVDAPLSEVLAHIADTAPKPPTRSTPGVDDEVETIVLKALAKEPDRRYQSALELARDVAQYLAGEPIDAKRDSVWYVVRKSLRRYRIAVATILAFVVVLSVALVVVVGYWRQSVDAERAAKRAQTRESVQRRAAELQAYIANVAAADAALRNNDVVSARQRLDRAPASLRDWEWHHLRSRVDLSQRVLPMTSFVHGIAFSGGRDLVAGADWKNQVRVWNQKTGELVHTFKGQTPAERVAFHTASNQLAVAYRDGKIRMWDLSTKNVVQTLDGLTPDAKSLEFSEDGTLLAAAYAIYPDPGGHNAVRIWHLGTANVQTLPQPGYVNSVSLSRDGKRAVVCGQFGVTEWNLTSEKRTATISTEPCNDARLSAIGHWLVSAHGNEAQVWAGPIWKRHRTLRGHSNAILSVAIDDLGQKVATASRDKTARVWRARTGRVVGVFAGHTWSVVAVALSTDGKLLATGAWDATVRLWPLVDSSRVPRLRGHTGIAYGVVYTRSGERLVSAGHDMTARVWDVASRRELTVLRGHTGPVRSVAANPRAPQIATGSFDKTVRLWSENTGELQRILRGHTDHVHSVAFSPDGKLLATGSKDNTIRIWNSETGASVTVLKEHTDHVHTVAFSPDGRTLASSGHQSIRLWDTATWRHRTTLKRSIVQGDFSLAFSPDSRRIAAGANYKTLGVWDVASGRVEATLAGHTDEIHAATFSPDGSRLVTASLDGSVLIWDATTWIQLASLHGYSGHINWLSFSPDGGQLAGALADGSIKLWGSKKTADPLK